MIAAADKVWVLHTEVEVVAAGAEKAVAQHSTVS
jgi:hypothetical protein